MGDVLSLSVEFAAATLTSHPRFGFVITNHRGIPVINVNNRYQPSAGYTSPVSGGIIRCDLGMVPLVAGRYAIDLYLGNEGEDIHIIEQALSFEVIEQDIWGHGRVPQSDSSCLWWPTTFELLSLQESGK